MISDGTEIYALLMKLINKGKYDFIVRPGTIVIMESMYKQFEPKFDG